MVFDAWETAWAFADVLQTTGAPASAWQQRRARRLAELLHEVAPRSRLYRERLAKAGRGTDDLTTLQRMAPLGKREAMQRFGDWVTEPLLSLDALRTFVHDRSRRGDAFLDRWLAWESSGSTGEPALFVQDARALAVADAIEAVRGPLSLLGVDAPGTAWGGVPLRIALVGAADGHFASIVAFERARALNPWVASVSRAFSFLQPIETLMAQLEAFPPTVLASYPSMAWVLAQAAQAGHPGIAPRAIWTGGETLTPAVRTALAQRFHAPVRDSYGASECFLIGSECRAGRLHLHADWVILEPVDEQGRVVPDGEVGHTTLLTNLANHVQPIIRWDIGDRVRIVPGASDPAPTHGSAHAARPACACGSSLPVIEVQGRCDDVLTLLDAKGRAVHLAPLALTTVLEDEAGIFDFQLRRRGDRALQLDVYGTQDIRRVAPALRAYLRANGLAGVSIDVRHAGPSGSRGRSGKQQRVVCGARA
jgi:phenylacetate-coenzyme A ligase PaaK-like adenylate-forming protein